MTTQFTMTKAQLKQHLIVRMTELFIAHGNIELSDADGETGAFVITAVEAAVAFAENAKLSAGVAGVKIDE